MDYITNFHGILETLKAGGTRMKLLVAEGTGSPRQGPRVRDILERARQSGVAIEGVETVRLDRIDPGHKGVVLELTDGDAGHRPSLEEFLLDPPARALVLILDHIEDPQNFGAILRSADAFGVSLVIAPTRRASPLSEAASRTSAGAAAWVPVAFVQNLADAMRKIKSAGFWVYAADMDGEPLTSVRLPERTCFVLGNEGGGVSRLLAEKADATVSIPMVGHVDSLNVSVASALCMYEYRRTYPER